MRLEDAVTRLLLDSRGHRLPDAFLVCASLRSGRFIVLLCPISTALVDLTRLGPPRGHGIFVQRAVIRVGWATALIDVAAAMPTHLGHVDDPPARAVHLGADPLPNRRRGRVLAPVFELRYARRFPECLRAIHPLAGAE